MYVPSSWKQLKEDRSDISRSRPDSIEWEPDLLEGARPPQIKRLELQAEAGKSYWLAARVDVDAPAESQLDQSWWEVFVFREE